MSNSRIIENCWDAGAVWYRLRDADFRVPIGPQRVTWRIYRQAPRFGRHVEAFMLELRAGIHVACQHPADAIRLYVRREGFWQSA
jgi:hypothetical protein